VNEKATMRNEDLVRRCDEYMAAQPIVAEMAFVNGYMTLGAGTRLAKIGAPLDEPRLAALLTSAHGGPIEASRLTHVRRAVETWRDGDRVVALTHLALSRLAKLGDPLEGARRLFLADALIDAGVAPSAIVAALTSETTSGGSPAAKYSPDQPRVPAGNPDGGQWTNDWVGDAGAQPPVRTRGVQIADASSNWAQYLEPSAGSSRSETGGRAPSRAQILLPPSSNFVNHVNVSCEEIAESDLAICRSAIFDGDPYFQGQCMKGMPQRMDECAKGLPLSPLLPY
jgi:hypothetical protein